MPAFLLLKMNIRTVSGKLLKIDNSPWANERVIFVLNKGSFTTDATYLPDRKIATTDSEGNFSIDLWTNAEGAIASEYTCILPSLEEFDFTIPAGSPVSIEFLRSLQTPSQPTPQTVLDFVEDYLDSRIPGLATPTSDGLQSAADKTKLNGIQTGATANSTDAQLRDRSTHTGTQLAATISDFTTAARASFTQGSNITITNGVIASTGGTGVTDLSIINRTTTTLDIASSSGIAATVPAATTSLAGLFTSVEKTKLNEIATAATANSSDATLLNRANHTGTQAWSTITTTPTTVAGYGITDAVLTSDSRLTDARTPLAHNQAWTTITGDRNFPAQGSSPPTPASGFTLFADSSNRLSWEGANGWIRTFDGTANTADRAYTLPDLNGTIALTSQLTGKADLTGATFTGAIQVPSAVVTTGSSGISLWHGGDSATPVNLTTYNATGSERGLSVPQLRCTNGRIDIQPLAGAVEFRITGASTQLRFWNSTNANSYLTINSDRSVNLFNTLNSAGRIVVTDTTTSTSTTTGSATFAGGVGVAGTVTADSMSLTNALSITNGGTGAVTAAAARSNLGIILAFDYVQQSVPSSPTDRQRWLELDASSNPVGRWYWDAANSRWLAIDPVVTGLATTLTATSTTRIPSQTISGGGGYLVEGLEIIVGSATAHDSTNYFNMELRTRTASGTTTNITSANANTQTLAAATITRYAPTFTSQAVSTLGSVGLVLQCTKFASAPNLDIDVKVTVRKVR
jgi:hypothetical protein